MNTRYLDTSEEDIKTACGFLQSGGIVVFPTETVYGLGALADQAQAVKKVFAAKGRPADNPLIVHVDSLDMVREYARNFSSVEEELLRRFSPGPLTLIVDRVSGRAEAAAAGHPTLGIRIPRSQAALALIRGCGSGIAAPSANRSGRPSPTDFDVACREMDGRVDAIMRGEPADQGLESTIVRVNAGQAYILRPGTISAGQIRDAFRDMDAGIAVSEGHGGEQPAAPGTRYRHYAPRAQVFLVESPEQFLERYHGQADSARVQSIVPREWLRRSPEIADLHISVSGHSFHVLDDLKDYERRLYRMFVDADISGRKAIFCWLPSVSSESSAIRDRLLRAAQG